MISLLLLGLIASVYAAPHYEYHHRSDLDNNDYSDTNRFWADSSKRMKNLNEEISEFNRPFSARSFFYQESIQGNEYIITFYLSGFEEKDITVKASEGLVTIQAYSNAVNYLNTRALPDTVNTNGTWSYKNNILKIVFPLKQGFGTETVETASAKFSDVTTEISISSREDTTHIVDLVDDVEFVSVPL